jgi:S-(hydroxymethyl)glutathione dehydrogenase/alcohol dehydrogenase
MRIRAAMLEAPGTALRVDHVDLEGPAPGEVLVRMGAAGFCRSDLHAVNGDLKVPLPAVLGHEGAGIVDACGPGVSRVRPGDHVVLSWITPCGRCYYCLRARPDVCEQATTLNTAGTLPGGVRRLARGGDPLYHYLGVSCFAEFTVVAEAAVIPIDPSIPLDRAALAGCAVTTGFGAVTRTAEVEAGESVAVIGAGGVGLNVIQTAALVGAEPIVAIDRGPDRLAMARRFGATHVIDNETDPDPVRAVLALTDGRGVDVAFEVVGRPETIEAAYHLTRKAGRTVVVGVAPPGARVSLNAFAIPATAKVLMGSWYGQTVPAVDIPLILRLYQTGRLDLDALVTGTVALEEINRAIADMRAGTGVRTVVTFGH